MSASLPRQRVTLHYLAGVASLAAAYYVVARFGLTWATVEESVTAIWPPSGLSLAVLLLFGWRLWPGIFVGALFANLDTSATFASAGAIAVGNTCEALAGVALLNWSGFDKRLGRLSDVLRLILLGALGSPLLAATNGAVQLCLAGLAPWSQFSALWLAWWLGDGLSIMILTPLVLAWAQPLAWPRPQQVAEAAATAAALGAVCAIAFGLHGEAPRPALAYAVFPLTLGAAIRLRLRGATAAVLLITAVTMWAAALHPDLFSMNGMAEGLVILQVFTGSVALSSLALAAALAEQDNTLSALQRSQAETSQAQARLSDAIESLRDHFILYDKDDRVVLINEVARNWHPDFAKAAVPGAHITDLARAAARTGLIAGIGYDEDAAIRARMSVHRRSFGKVLERQIAGRWLQIREFPTRDGGLLVLRSDITELKHAMDALEKSEHDALRANALLIDAIESLDDGFLLWDSDDRLVLHNQALRRMLPGEANFLAPGITFTELVERRVRTGQILEAIGREDAFIRERIAAHRNPTGGALEQHFATDIWVNVRERRTREGGLVVILHDITALKRREAELIATRSEAISANRAKSEFLAMMSHELRTPLNVVIGFAEILRDQGGRLPAVKVMDYASDVYEAARHLLNLLNDVLDLSKAEAGKMELQRGPVDLRVVIDRSLRMVKERAVQRRISLTTDLADDLPILDADERKVAQILINLLSNAVKFTPEGGHVRVIARREGTDRVLVQVIDNGIGIAPENIAQALTAFGQVSNLFTRDQAGTGLGLPLAKQLAELHGATLDLESTVGAGTTVSLRFPLPIAASTAVA